MRFGAYSLYGMNNPYTDKDVKLAGLKNSE
jgi:hypothetical protein